MSLSYKVKHSTKRDTILSWSLFQINTNNFCWHCLFAILSTELSVLTSSECCLSIDLVYSDSQGLNINSLEKEDGSKYNCYNTK